MEFFGNVIYKGYEIDNGGMIPNMATVFYDGDEFVFACVEQAMDFIDSLEKEAN